MEAPSVVWLLPTLDLLVWLLPLLRQLLQRLALDLGGMGGAAAAAGAKEWGRIAGHLLLSPSRSLQDAGGLAGDSSLLPLALHSSGGVLPLLPTLSRGNLCVVVSV